MAAARIERRLAAILAADVVGYSSLMERDEAGTLERLKAHRREFVDPLIAEHRGRIVKLMGDGALVEFASVVDAVACAVAIQRGHGRARAGRAAGGAHPLPDRREPRRRDRRGRGHLRRRRQRRRPPGEAGRAGRDLRLGQGARGAAQAARARLRARWVAQRVKNIAEPVEAWRVVLGGVPGARRLLRVPRVARRAAAVAMGLLLLVAIGGGAWWLWPQRPSLATQPSVAVLPFANLGGDEATGRLADGITEDIITDLSRYRELDVIAQNSTAVYKGKPADVREIGRALNVRYVLGRLDPAAGRPGAGHGPADRRDHGHPCLVGALGPAGRRRVRRADRDRRAGGQPHRRWRRHPRGREQGRPSGSADKSLGLRAVPVGPARDRPPDQGIGRQRHPPAGAGGA